MTPEQRTRIEECGCTIVEVVDTDPGCPCEPDHPSGRPRIHVGPAATPEAIDMAAAHLEALRDGTDPPTTAKEAQQTADTITGQAGLPPADIAALRARHGTLWRSVVDVAEQAAAAQGRPAWEVLARIRQRALGLVAAKAQVGET